MKENIPLKQISSKTVYQNPWIKIREDVTTDSNGNSGIYGVMESNNSVMVVAMNSDSEIYLIRKFSYPSQDWSWELPGGGDDNEEVVIASRRELFEETGISAETMTVVGETRACNGLMTEIVSTVLAQNLKIHKRPENTDDNDLISGGQFFSINEIKRLIKSGEIDDNQTITGIYLAKIYLNNARLE